MTSRPHFRRGARLPATVVLAATVAAILALTGGEASAAHVSCGDMITVDTTLDSDLINCPNNGIVIGADNISLDLNGHTVDGDGTPASGCDPNSEVCDSGVVDDGHNGITVMHGRVREFGVGVLLGTSTAGRVRDNRVLGVSSTGNQSIALGIFSSVRSLVRDSSGNGSRGSEDAAGMALADARHVRIIDNSFRGNTLGIVTADSSRNVIKGNLVRDSRADGFRVEESDHHSLLKRNVAKGAGDDGFDVDSRSTTLTKNRAVRNGDLGIEAIPGVIDGGENRASRNGDARQCVNVTCH
jgi:parallel beta-helix repeat protein